MGTWVRGIRTGVIALSLGGLLAGCDGDGGGLNFFFGMNGNGSCSNLVVDVDLEAAGAFLDDNGDAVDCVLSSLLENDGCDATFTEIEGGDVLRVTISGCTIPAIASLFECGFEDADLSELADQVDAQCTCSSQGCDTTPPVCVSENSDPDSCEDCDNGEDDDGNGDTDCDDDNCQYSPVCEPETTTTTTTSTTSTTTLPPTGCTVVFRLDDDVTLGSLQWTTTYDASVEPDGSGAAVACTSLIDGALAAFNDIEAQNKLEAGLVSLDGINGPINVASCTVDTDGGASAADFSISDIEAATVDLELVVPAPAVVIDSVLCGGDTTTTTTSSSSTTTIDTTTTTTLVEGTTPYSILFKLDTASTSLGALQFSIDYSGAPGEFQGSGGTVVCSNKVVGALFAPNDNDAANKLSLGIIALSPFSAPGDLVQCTFDATETPVPGDFPITIEDATDSDGVPATAEISVTVTAL